MPFVRAALCRVANPFRLVAVASFLVSACGGKTADGGPGGPGGPVDTGTDALIGTDAPIGSDAGFSCPSEPLSREVVASTPRADAELEMLALTMGTTIVAEEAIYARVVRDVASIRAERPELVDIKPRAPYPQRLHIFADRVSAEAMRDGKSPELACRDAYWGAIEGAYTFSTDGKSGSTELSLKGLYAVDRLACIYLTVPGVFQVQGGSSLIGDGPVLFAWIEGDVYHYAFDRAGGDCPAGCTSHHVWHYASAADGAVKLVEELPDGAPSPTWWSHRYYRPDKCLTL